MADTALPVSIAVYSRFAAVTPADGSDLAAIPDAFTVGVAGAVAVWGRDGVACTIGGLQPGQIYPFSVRRILATGTTATGIIALYKGV